METLLCAIGFVLVLEGFLPFIAPDFWKRAVRESTRIPSEKIRIIGFGSVVLGLAVVWSTMLFF